MTLRLGRSWPLAAVACLALAAVLAGSCSPKRVDKRHEVVFWIAWPPEAITPLTRRFETENPTIRVKLVPIPWDSGADSLSAALAGGSPPDLCQLHSMQLAPFMAGNALSDWSAGVADLREGLRGWPMVMVGDAIYGLPWLLRTQVLYWNRDLFMRARLGPARGPATWDELRDAAAKIQQLGDGVHGYGIAMSDSGASFRPVVPFMLGNGGGLLTAMFDSSRFATPQNVQALIYVQSLRPSSLLAGDDSLAREFAAGRLGMVLAGSELALRLAKSAPSLRYGMELVPQPGPDRGAHVSVVAGEVLVSFTSSKRKEDALKLARFLVRDENAHGLATALQFMQPPNRSADTTSWYRARAEQLIMFRQIDAGQYLPNHRDWSAMHRVMGIELGAAVAGRQSALQAVTAADTFITSHLGSR